MKKTVEDQAEEIKHLREALLKTQSRVMELEVRMEKMESINAIRTEKYT